MDSRLQVGLGYLYLFKCRQQAMKPWYVPSQQLLHPSHCLSNVWSVLQIKFSSLLSSSMIGKTLRHLWHRSVLQYSCGTSFVWASSQRQTPHPALFHRSVGRGWCLPDSWMTISTTSLYSMCWTLILSCLISVATKNMASIYSCKALCTNDTVNGNGEVTVCMIYQLHTI